MLIIAGKVPVADLWECLFIHADQIKIKMGYYAIQNVEMAIEETAQLVGKIAPVGSLILELIA